MKLKSILIISVLCLLCFCGCGDKNTENVDINETESATNEEVGISVFPVNKTVYEDNLILLECKEINNNEVIFNFTNKSNTNLSLWMIVSLDGIMLQNIDTSDTKFSANENKEFIIYTNLSNPEHKLMSVYGLLFYDNYDPSNVPFFDVCDINLGGEYNPEKIESGENIYSSDSLSIEFIGTNVMGLKFLLYNKTNETIEFRPEKITINDDDTNYADTVTSILGKTKQIYIVDILSQNEKFCKKDVKTFNGVFHVNKQGNIIDSFDIQYKIKDTQK